MKKYYSLFLACCVMAGFTLAAPEVRACAFDEECQANTEPPGDDCTYAGCDVRPTWPLEVICYYSCG